MRLGLLLPTPVPGVVGLWLVRPGRGRWRLDVGVLSLLLLVLLLESVLLLLPLLLLLLHERVMDKLGPRIQSQRLRSPPRQIQLLLPHEPDHPPPRHLLVVRREPLHPAQRGPVERPVNVKVLAPAARRRVGRGERVVPRAGDEAGDRALVLVEFVVGDRDGAGAVGADAGGGGGGAVGPVLSRPFPLRVERALPTLLLGLWPVSICKEEVGKNSKGVRGQPGASLERGVVMRGLGSGGGCARARRSWQPARRV